MSVVYINSNEVCVSDDKFTKLYYNATKETINYQHFMRAVQGHGKPIIILDSDLIFSEYKSFINGLGKAERFNIIERRLNSPNSVCANTNGLFPKGKGADHQNDLIITQINYDERENHIRTCLQKLSQSNLDLHRIYSYIQALHTIELQYSKINTAINIHVIIIGSKAILTTSNTTYFMFGRVINKREGEELMDTITKLLATTIKFVGTTYSFLHNPMNITIMSDEKLDISGITETDPVFDNVQVTFQEIKLPVIAFASDVPSITNDLALIKLALPKIHKIRPIDNLLLKNQKKMYKIIKGLKIFSYVCVFCVAVYVGYLLYMTRYLDKENKKVDNEYKLLKNTYDAKIKNIKDREMDVYQSVALEVENNTKFINIHEDVFRTIANIFSRYRENMLVEGFDFKCENCDNGNASYKISVKIVIHNPSQTVIMPNEMMKKIKNEILSTFGRTHSNIKVEFPEFSNDNKKLSAIDARDTVEISFKQAVEKKEVAKKTESKK